jgi:hypothetical protein
MDIATALPRVKKFLAHRFGFIKESLRKHVVDPRDDRGKRRDYMALLHLIFATLLAGGSTPREAETLSEFLYIPDSLRKDKKSGRIPDTTLYEFSAQLHWREFTPVLVEQVRAMNRKSELSPVDLPCGVVVVDGKSLGKLSHSAQGMALKQSSDHPEPFYHLRVLRAVLSSSGAKVCLGQEPLGATEGESTTFPRFGRWLCETYGRYGLFEILDVDAGFLSRATFRFVDQELNYGLVAGLKRNQPDLYREARRILVPLWKSQPPEAIRDWEPFQGREIRRQLYRTFDLEGYLDWQHLRQVWLVVQETREKVALTQEEQKRELEKAKRREKRKRPRLMNPRLALPVLLPGQSPSEVPQLKELLASRLKKIRGNQANEEMNPSHPEAVLPESQSDNRLEIKKKAAKKVKKDAASSPSSDSGAANFKKSKKRPHVEPNSNANEDEIESVFLSDDGYLVTVELRFFVSNLTGRRLTPDQILLVVRNHWAVENDCFHSLDVQWREDAPSWSTAGEAQLSLGMLRLLAYNYDQQLRKKHVRVPRCKLDGTTVRPWRQLFLLVSKALELLFPLVPLDIHAASPRAPGRAVPDG